MSDIARYLETARERGVPVEVSTQLLLAAGWDPSDISRELTGQTIPAPPRLSAGVGDDSVTVAPQSAPVLVPGPANDVAQPQIAQKYAHGRPGLSPALAAMHHVFLWFFVGSSTVGINAAVAVLLNGSAQPGDLNSFLAVTSISSAVYFGFFWVYLRGALRPPYLTAHRVWTTITVCLLGVGSMTAAIILLINLLDGERIDTIVTASIVLVLYLCLLVNYIAATFLDPGKRIRKPVLLAAVPFVALVLVVLFVASVLSIGPSRRDEATREDLVSAGAAVSEYVADNQRLPASESELDLPDGVTYRAEDEVTYELCAVFERNFAEYGYGTGSPGGAQAPALSDEYLSSSDFYADAGESCFTLESWELSEKESADS